MHGQSLIGVSLALLTLGCGAVPLDPQDHGSDTGADTSSADESSGDDGTTGPVDLGPSCAPPDASLSLAVDVGGSLYGRTCVVVEPVEGAAVSFECQGDGAPTSGSLFVDVSPPLPILIAVGAEVEIEVFVSFNEWESQISRTTVIVRHGATNELVVAAIDSYDADWTADLAPLHLAPIDGACESAPDESNCLTVDRRMWEASHDGATALVGDRTRTDVGGYAVHIQRAAAGDLLECIDVETDFYEALIVRTQ